MTLKVMQIAALAIVVGAAYLTTEHPELIEGACKEMGVR